MCTERLHSILSEDKMINGRATFIVHTFDAYVIEEQIDEILADSIRPTWEEVAKAINRHLEWEYDNIKYETIEQALERINRID